MQKRLNELNSAGNFAGNCVWYKVRGAARDAEESHETQNTNAGFIISVLCR